MTTIKSLVILLSILGLGGATYAVVNYYSEPTVVEELPIEEKPIEEPEQVASRPILEQEYLPEEPIAEPAVAPELPATSTETTIVAKPVIHHPDAVLQEEDMNRITTAWEYVANYAGTCPSQQPNDSAFKKDWKHRAAIGLWSEAWTPEHMVETYWNNYMDGTNFADEELMVNFKALGITNGEGLGFYVNWNTFDVYWDYVWQDHRGLYSNYNEGRLAPAEWDEMAIRMKNYLHYIDNLYHTRCPND